METDNKKSRDRHLTERKILDALGDIIKEEGFENVKVNSVSQRAGVSKMLIYRYFGNMDELIAKYILEKDYWINITADEFDIRQIGPFIKKVFRDRIAQLREDVTMRRLHRWELTGNHAVINQLREKRESNGYRLVEMVSRLTDSPHREVAALATIISASISYLTLLEEPSVVYNGIHLQSDEGWEQIARGIDLIIDLWMQKQE